MTDENDETDENDAIIEMLSEIRSAARHVASEWPDVVRSDDLENSMVTKLLEEKQATKLYGFAPGGRKKTLLRIGSRIASAERDDFEYFNGNYRYSVVEVRQLLDGGALSGSAQAIVEAHGRTRGQSSGGSTDALGFYEPRVEDSVEDIDVRVGFSRLTERQRELLFSKYVSVDYDEHPQLVAKAEAALTHAMNRNFRKRVSEYTGPGARFGVSSAKAQVINRTQTDGKR